MVQFVGVRHNLATEQQQYNTVKLQPKIDSSARCIPQPMLQSSSPLLSLCHCFWCVGQGPGGLGCLPTLPFAVFVINTLYESQNDRLCLLAKSVRTWP